MTRRGGRWLNAGVVAVAIADAILLSAVLVLVVMLSTPTRSAARLATPAPTASGIELMPMGSAHIPTSATCVLCHKTAGGIGLRVVPTIAHPVEGWTHCTSCHAEDSLVRTAPGHTGIAETECRNCHKTSVPGPAITRPHSLLRNQNCLSCHGSVVHLPASMVNMTQNQCWLCHRAAAEPPPEFPHPLDAELSCLGCHVAGKVAALPADHAGRTVALCVLCHDISPAATSASTIPHSLSGRTDLCVFCHALAPDELVR